VKRLKTLLLALALATGATLFVAPAAAHADDGPPPCDGILFQILGPDGKEHWICMPLYIEVDRDPRPDPCFCPEIAIQVIIDHVLPQDAEHGFVGGLSDGLNLLGLAAGARDARTAAALRGQAQEAFMGGVRQLGDTRLALGGVGRADPRTGEFEPGAEPWFEETAESLMGGSSHMQVAFCDPHIDPWWWLNAGMERFDEAFAGLAEHAPVGV
jgi:hypothetical protein